MQRDAVPIELLDHNPAWADIARTEAARLRGVLGGLIVDVHHVGSTAIPGIKAKPIVDLAPTVTSLDELDARAGEVTELGYEWRGEYGIKGRRYCPLTDTRSGKRLIHVHFFATDAPEIVRYLAFRDYLRAHGEEARAYETQKLAAAALHSFEMVAYTHAKGPWIKGCLERALAWAAEGARS
ncbi:MAG: GrpB family protein [Alphaproteobacteria bacterium]|nr:GrpB family protein [Alphaproteobacteria bacterium]